MIFSALLLDVPPGHDSPVAVADDPGLSTGVMGTPALDGFTELARGDAVVLAPVVVECVHVQLVLRVAGRVGLVPHSLQRLDQAAVVLLLGPGRHVDHLVHDACWFQVVVGISHRLQQVIHPVVPQEGVLGDGSKVHPHGLASSSVPQLTARVARDDHDEVRWHYANLSRH